MENLKSGSTGPSVALIQSILKKRRYYSGAINGIFNQETKESVARFQKIYGLISDGEVKSGTWRAFMPFINGYDSYTIKSNDTLYNIASAYGVNINQIITANPDIDLYNLQQGQKIIVPFEEVVPTDVSYTYELLTMNIKSLHIIYPFLEIGYIGRSTLLREIPYIKIGTGSKTIFYNASFHANEWITTPVLMKFVEQFSLAYTNQSLMYGYNPREIFEHTTIYIVPMVNPDGVDLVTGGLSPDSYAYHHAKTIAGHYPDIPFPDGWKANIEGIDLNLQFPAGWEQARENKYQKGFTSPAPRDYVGSAPLTTNEAKAVYDFTLEQDFDLIIAYHTQGEVIYWKYLDYIPENSYEIGQEFAQMSGYLLEETPYASSFAGYKDWFIQTYNRPGYTIEVGRGVNPLPISQFDTIYAQNEGILVLGAVLA